MAERVGFGSTMLTTSQRRCEFDAKLSLKDVTMENYEAIQKLKSKIKNRNVFFCRRIDRSDTLQFNACLVFFALLALQFGF